MTNNATSKLNPQQQQSLCSHLISMLSSLGIGPDTRLRYYVANELYFLLKLGPIELEKHRNDSNWWG